MLTRSRTRLVKARARSLTKVNFELHRSIMMIIKWKWSKLTHNSSILYEYVIQYYNITINFIKSPSYEFFGMLLGLITFYQLEGEGQRRIPEDIGKLYST